MSSMPVLSGGLGGVLIALVLVILLMVRLLISNSPNGSKKKVGTIDAIIIPLVIIFAATVAFQVLQAAHLLN
jgi:hypothetical protein